MIERVVIDVIKYYPEVKDGLRGYAAWIASVQIKAGESPDDEQRRMDERRMKRHTKAFLSEQMQRVLKSAEDMRDA